MANSKISALPSATTPLAGTEVLPIVQSGATDQVTVANLTAGRAVSVLSLTSTNDSTINGVKVGTGAGSIASNTAVGVNALNANTTGAQNTAVGNGAGVSTTVSGGNTAIGYRALFNGDGINNTCIGAQAGSSITSGTGNICIGSGAQPSSGTVTNEATLTNAAITNTRLYGTIQALNNNFVVTTAGKGINFTAKTPAAGMTSQLLNWYEEGTWTPNQGAGLTLIGAFSSTGKYTRIGREVRVSGTVTGATSVALAAAGIITTNLPFTVGTAGHGNVTNAALTSFAAIICTSTNVTSAGAIAATGTLTFSATYFI